MNRDFTGIGFDPAPGSAASVDAVAGRLLTAAHAVESAAQCAATAVSGWEGDAAAAFARRAGDLPKALRDGADALRAGCQLLGSWHTRLEQYQRTARGYEDAAHGLDAASYELQQLRHRARALLAQHEDDADEIARALLRARPSTPHHAHRGGTGLRRLGHAIKNWATRHAGLLRRVGDTASGTSAVLGIAALATMWCPPLSAALGAGAAGASAVAVASHGLAKLGGADVSWASIALEGVGALPFAGTAVRGAKGVTMGVRAFAAEGSLAAGAGEVLQAGREITAVAGQGSALHRLLLAPAVRRTSLLGGELSPKSWWSRGIQIGVKGTGLALHLLPEPVR